MHEVVWLILTRGVRFILGKLCVVKHISCARSVFFSNYLSDASLFIYYICSLFTLFICRFTVYNLTLTIENQPVQLRNARLITDRATGASRGYGYVEFDHPQELITFVTLTNPQLCGRNVKVDVATGTPREGSERGGNRRRSESNRNGRRESNRGPRGEGRDSNRRGSEQREQSQKELPKDVGSQFMGGRYARSDSASGRGGSMKRNDSSASQGSGGMGGGGGDTAARQRPSLKLAPRTKPVEKEEGGTTQSSIFGGAKPRDESKFLEKKDSSVDAAVKDSTGSMKAMNVSDESGDANKDSIEAADATTSEPSEKQPHRRQDSKAGGRGGRKDNNGRRDSTRKSGKDGERGRGGGGGRGEKGRGRGEGGRNGKRNSTKSNGDSNDKTQSSLAAAAAAGASTPTPMPVQTEKKGPPKKTNSFAAFMDDSDED